MNTSSIRHVKTRERFWGIGGEFQYFVCPICDTWVLTPPPSDELLAHHYEGYYPPEEYEQREVKPINAVEQVRAKQSVDALAKLGVLSTLKHVLDIGTGCAGFLAALKMIQDVQVWGCDQNPASAELAKRLFDIEVEVGTVANLIPSDRLYDLVTLWHCFEHVRCPHQTLLEIRKLMSPKGILLMEVPTPGFWAHWFKGAWLFLQAPTHLNIFTEKALVDQLHAAGFAVLRKERPWSPSEWAGSILFQMGFSGFMPRLYFRTQRLSDHIWRLFFFLLMPLDLVFTGIASLFGSSGLLRVYAQPSSDEPCHKVDESDVTA